MSKPKLIRMDKRPAIQVDGLIGVIKMKVVTTGDYKQDSTIEVSFTAKLKLDECTGMDGDNAKNWHASVLELYQKGRQPCPEKTSTINRSTIKSIKAKKKNQLGAKRMRKRPAHLLKKTR